MIKGKPQGYQIGRIFSHWVAVYFGQFLKITEVAHNFLATFLYTIMLMY
jgi:hypothetical protein